MVRLPLVSLAAFAVASSLSAVASGEEEPVLYYNGVVFTGRSDVPDATWFVVQGHRFMAVGDASVEGERRASIARSVDLGGRFVLPGFVDAHTHFVDGGLTLVQCDLGGASRVDALGAALRTAAEASSERWIVARNLGLEPFGGRLPSHKEMEPFFLGDRPAYVTLKGGHHVYVNRAGLAELGIDAATEDPARGRIERGADGVPTGVLVDEAAWSALRRIYGTLSHQTISAAILAAQEAALSYGLTSIGDNTFFPDHMAKYRELLDAGFMHMRVSSRAFGAAPITKFLMKSIGTSFFGTSNEHLQFFATKYFADQSLTLASSEDRPEIGGEVQYDADRLVEIFLFGGRYGVAFHVQGPRAIARILEAKARIAARRDERAIDVLDHCGTCGETVLKQIKELGFRVTILPGQLYDLPELVNAYSPEQAKELLPFRAMFESGVRPAFTSDWPHGVAKQYPSLEGGSHRAAFSPLALIALATSGVAPDGGVIPHASERTVRMGDALRAYTTFGAAAIGRDSDLGQIAPSYLADFVILEKSPFEVAPVDLYRMPIVATYVDGQSVFDSASRAPVAPAVPDFDGSSWGWTPSPIIGYDPTPGLILGGAFFFYPYRHPGWIGSVQVMSAVEQLRFAADATVEYARAMPWLSTRAAVHFTNWKGRYYGFGMNTDAHAYVETDPQRIEVEIGPIFHLAEALRFEVAGRFIHLRDRAAPAILGTNRAFEGVVDGAYAAGRLEVVHDTRESSFSTRYGGERSLWVEYWAAQGGQSRPLARLGFDLTQFIPVYAPDVILALSLNAGVSVGEPGYASSFQLGGIERLRGYLANRFRGHHMAAATAELRFPIWSFVSGAAFVETGKTWAERLEPVFNDIGAVWGAGLRFGLPPDQLVKLRFDAGFSSDQWGIFFAFNEVF